MNLAANLARLRHPDVVAAAVLLDLTIVVPLLFIVLVARGARKWVGITPVVLASLVGAGLVLPVSYRAALPVLRLLVLPAELATVAFVVQRVRRGFRDLGTEGDVVDRLDRALSAAVPYPRLARVLAYEISVLYFGIFSWRDRPEAFRGRAFSYHRAGSYGAIVFALMIVSACEIVGAHLAVSHASPAAAWLLTVLGLYGVVWLLGDYQASRLRPLVIGPDVLLVRLGLRWHLPIPHSDIAAVLPITNPTPSKRRPGHLHAALLTRPQLVIKLRRPLLAQGPYGITKSVTTVSLAADNREGLRRALVDLGLLNGFSDS
jgi:hypothetical protein